jgi:hypothetical protein
MDIYFKYYCSFLALKQVVPTELIVEILSTVDLLYQYHAIDDALLHGWKYEGKYLLPPIQFSCYGWSGYFKNAYNGDKNILVPHWLYDDNVRRTGSPPDFK